MIARPPIRINLDDLKAKIDGAQVRTSADEQTRQKLLDTVRDFTMQSPDRKRAMLPESLLLDLQKHFRRQIAIRDEDIEEGKAIDAKLAQTTMEEPPTSAGDRAFLKNVVGKAREDGGALKHDIIDNDRLEQNKEEATQQNTVVADEIQRFRNMLAGEGEQPKSQNRKPSEEPDYRMGV